MMAGETCGTATTIMAGMIGGTTMGAMNDVRLGTANGCAGSNAAVPDVYYAISVPSQSRLTVNINATWDTVINLIEEPASNCGSALADGGLSYTCVAGADAIGSNETVSYSNTTAAARTIYIHVDGWSSTDLGLFTLNVAVAPIPAGDVCATAPVLTLPANLMAQTLVGFAQDYTASGGCASGSTSLDRAYRVNVPAGNRLSATVTASVNPDGGVAFAPTVNIVGTPACAANLTCVAGGNSSTTPGVATATFDNGGTARDVFVVVDTSTTNPGGTFSLSLAATPVMLQAGDVCANTAAPVTMSTTLQNETFVGYNDQYFSSFQSVCRYVTGVDRAYAVTIPAGQILTATAIATDAGVLPDGGTMNLALSVILPTNECQSGPCLAATDSTTAPGGSEVVSRNNTGTAAETVLVVVDSNLVTPTPAATYSLALNIAAPAVGDTCSDSQPAISMSSMVTGQTLAGFSNDFTSGTGCGFASGPDRVYRITIPAMSRLTATTVTPVTADHALSIVDGLAAACNAPTTCAASIDDDPTGGGETITFDNATASARTVFLIVDRFSGADAFDLNVTFAAITTNAGETCQMPQVIAMSGTLTGQTTVGYINNIQTVNAALPTMGACTNYATTYPGRDRVYQIDVAAGQTLTAVVTPTTSFDAAIYFVASPDSNCLTMGTTCIGQGDDTNFGGTGMGAAETGTYTNSSGATQTVFIVVDTFSSSGTGGFDLTVSLMP
jgi:hypothetical protein